VTVSALPDFQAAREEANRADAILREALGSAKDALDKAKFAAAASELAVTDATRFGKSGGDEWFAESTALLEDMRDVTQKALEISVKGEAAASRGATLGVAPERWKAVKKALVEADNAQSEAQVVVARARGLGKDQLNALKREIASSLGPTEAIKSPPRTPGFPKPRFTFGGKLDGPSSKSGPSAASAPAPSLAPSKTAPAANSPAPAAAPTAQAAAPADPSSPSEETVATAASISDAPSPSDPMVMGSGSQSADQAAPPTLADDSSAQASQSASEAASAQAPAQSQSLVPEASTAPPPLEEGPAPEAPPAEPIQDEVTVSMASDSAPAHRKESASTFSSGPSPTLVQASLVFPPASQAVELLAVIQDR